MRDHRIENLSNVWERAEKAIRSQKPEPEFPTGIRGMDEMAHGFSRLVNIIAARTSEGKSSLAVQSALHIADRKKKKVLFITIEDDNEYLVEKMINRACFIDNADTARGILTDEQAKVARELFKNLTIYSCDSYGFNWEEFKEIGDDALASKNRPDILFFDFLQMIEPPNGMSMYEGYVNFMRNIHQWSKQNKMPVVVCSQIRRPPDGIVKSRPTIFELEGAGRMEQGAYQILLLHRPQKHGLSSSDYNPKMKIGFEEPPESYLELFLGKMKRAELGMVKCKWVGKHYLIDDFYLPCKSCSKDFANDLQHETCPSCRAKH